MWHILLHIAQFRRQLHRAGFTGAVVQHLPPLAADSAPASAALGCLQEVEIEFTGVERVDTSWVLPTYRRATPPINADKRKVRLSGGCGSAAACSAAQRMHADSSIRRFCASCDCSARGVSCAF